MTIQRKLNLQVLVFAVIFIGGCCSDNRPKVIEGPSTQSVELQFGLASAAKCLDDASQRGKINVLALSGGGSYAPWAPGVVIGSRKQSSDFPRKFDLITAISAGALSATHIFLGEDSDLCDIGNGLTTTEPGDIYSERCLLQALLCSAALRDTEKLDEILREYLPDALIQRVANAEKLERRVRKLFVGSVDSDTGHLVIHDMVSIARRGAYEDYRQAIKASTAVPVLFDPVFMNGGREMHIDGGVRAQIFLKAALIDPLSKVCHSASPNCTIDVYAIVNGGVGVETNKTPACIVPIALRSISILLDESMIQSLNEIAVVVGPRAKYHLSYIPADMHPSWPNSEFDPAKMKVLFDSAIKWGSTREWKSKPPSSPFIIRE